MKALDIFTWFLLFCLGLYTLLAFLNLSYLPIAWIDETYFLDPAIQFLKTGTYGSKVWPQEGTEKFLFAHMPMISLVHILNLSLFPWEIFYVRLPFLLIFIIGMYFYYQLLHEGFGLENAWALFVVFLFVNDKSTGEAIRSVRTETIEIMWMAVIFWRMYTDKNSAVTIVCLSFLALTHPKSWAMVGILVLWILWEKRKKKSLFWLPLLFGLPILLFLAWGKFDILLLKAQLWAHAEEHGPATGGGNLVWNHFVIRFWPYYTVQPYVFLLYLLSLLFAVRAMLNFGSFKDRLLEICFVGTNLYWFLKLGPYPRYDTVLLFFSYAICGKHLHTYLKAWKVTKKQLLWLALLFPFVTFVYLSRHGASILQREERDLAKVLTWYDRYLGNKKEKKILLLNESSGHYYAITHPWVDFTCLFSLWKFRFEDYDEVYISSWSRIDQPGVRFVSEYKVPTVLEGESQKRPMTYAHTKLYQVVDAEAFRALDK